MTAAASGAKQDGYQGAEARQCDSIKRLEEKALNVMDGVGNRGGEPVGAVRWNGASWRARREIELRKNEGKRFSHDLVAAKYELISRHLDFRRAPCSTDCR
jgi:hypothetical protein